MVDIKTDSNELLLMLTEPQHRIKWMKSLNNITLKGHKINRILSVHECLIGSNQIEVSIEEVTTNDLGINFFERARMKHPQLDFLVLYHLEKKNNKITRLGIGNHFYKTRYWSIKLFLIPVFSLMFRLFNYINLKRLNKYAEKELLYFFLFCLISPIFFKIHLMRLVIFPTNLDLGNDLVSKKILLL